MPDYTTQLAAPIPIEAVRSGSVWKCDWPMCWTVIVQYVRDNQYLMMSEPLPPAPCFGDGTAMQVHSGVLYSQQEVCDFLNRNRAERLTSCLRLIEKE